MHAKLIMSTLAGSHLYGTNRPDSDIDVRGVCFSPKHNLLGLQGFDQFQPSGPSAVEWSRDTLGIESDDVTVYAVAKFFSLCLKANPNIIELLFAPNDKLLYTSPTWDTIRANRDLFLSTKIVHTFAGYAYSQLSRIQRHKRWLDNPPTEPNPSDYGLYSDAEGAQKWENEQLANQYRNLRKKYKDYQSWLKNRNPARAKLEKLHGYDTKHAMHLYRLSLEAQELLMTGNLSLPLLPAVRDVCLSVLNGNARYETVVAHAEGLRDELLGMELDSPLPKRPNHKAAEELLIELQWTQLSNCDGLN